MSSDNKQHEVYDPVTGERHRLYSDFRDALKEARSLNIFAGFTVVKVREVAPEKRTPAAKKKKHATR